MLAVAVGCSYTCCLQPRLQNGHKWHTVCAAMWLVRTAQFCPTVVTKGLLHTQPYCPILLTGSALLACVALAMAIIRSLVRQVTATGRGNVPVQRLEPVGYWVGAAWAQHRVREPVSLYPEETSGYLLSPMEYNGGLFGSAVLQGSRLKKIGLPMSHTSEQTRKDLDCKIYVSQRTEADTYFFRRTSVTLSGKASLKDVPKFKRGLQIEPFPLIIKLDIK